jgi:preprotein translocase subunit SecG
MIKKRTSNTEVIYAIILVIVLFILGICLFLLLQHVPMKQLMYSFSANETKQAMQASPVIQSKQAAQASQASQAKQLTQSLQKKAFVPIHTSEESILHPTPIRNKLIFIPITHSSSEKKTTVKLTPVRDRITFTPIRRSPVTPSLYKLHHVEPIKLTRMNVRKPLSRKRRIPSKRIRKMHYVEVTPERGS